jgi:hypothetical protein
MDQPLAFEGVQRFRDAGPSHTKHQGEKLVGERQIADFETIMSHQNSASQSLIQLGPSIGNGRLGGLHHECLRELQERAAQCLGLFDLIRNSTIPVERREAPVVAVWDAFCVSASVQSIKSN